VTSVQSTLHVVVNLYFLPFHVLSQLRNCLSAAMNLHILFLHASMTGRHHNKPLDSLITILPHGSFLKIVTSILVTMFYLCIIMHVVFGSWLCTQTSQRIHATASKARDTDICANQRVLGRSGRISKRFSRWIAYGTRKNCLAKIRIRVCRRFVLY